MSNTTLVEFAPYPGLPPAAFHEHPLPAQAIMSRGSINDEGVWAAAVTMHLNTIDPRTGQPYNADVPLAQAAAGTIKLTASSCRSTAIAYSAETDRLTKDLLAEAVGHVDSALDQIEHSAGILSEPVRDPDGALITGIELQAIHSRDKKLAQLRSASGDARHTERTLESAWRLIAASMLAMLDVLLLWKPLLNLTWEANSGALFRWSIGAALAALQVLFIEWAMRSYITAERASVDQRGAAADYNRALGDGWLTAKLQAPDLEELAEADSHMGRAYRWLVLAAGFIAVIGGVRIAVLARRADLPAYESAVFATIIGIILGAVVILLARLYCRGNLLGDRLRAEHEVLAEIDRKIQHVRGSVAQERENAKSALVRADLAAEHAASLRDRVATDYWRSVQLVWTWFGLPHEQLHYDDFQREALPLAADTGGGRTPLYHSLKHVDEWLAKRPQLFTDPGPDRASLALTAGSHTATSDNLPALPSSISPPPISGRNIVLRPEPVTMPPVPDPPHWWMLAATAMTVLAAVATSWFAPGPEADDGGTAAPPVIMLVVQSPAL